MNVSEKTGSEPEEPEASVTLFSKAARHKRLSLETASQLYHIRSDSLYTRGLFTANPFSWVDLFGQFLYSRPHSTAVLSQRNTGNFIDFSALAFYTAQLDMVAGEARRPHTSGSFGAELRPLRRVRVIESWMTDRLHSAGSAMLGEMLLAGARTVSAERIFEARRLVLNYNQQQVDLVVDVTPALTLRGGHRYVWGDSQTPAGLVNLRLGDYTG